MSDKDHDHVVPDGLRPLATELTQAEAVQSVLLTISQAVWTSEELAELMEISHRQLGRLIDTTNFFVALYDPLTDAYTFPYHVDEFDDVDAETPTKLPRSFTDFVRRTGEPLLADSALNQRLVAAGEIELIGTEAASWMGAPLRAGDSVTGVVVVQSYTEESAYTQRDLEVLTFVSENIAMAIERQQAQKALRENERRLFQFLEMVPAGILVVDAKTGAQYYANQRAKEVLGSGDGDDGIGVDDLDAYPAYIAGTDDPYPVERMPIVRALGGEEAAVDDMEIRPPGHQIPLHVKASPIFGSDGEVEYSVAAFFDLTESKQAQQQLRQAQKMEAIGQLAGGVAHDFNNLLTGITGYTQLALGRCDPDVPTAADLRHVLECAGRAAGLTRQLLAFSRRMPLETKVFNINTLVEQTSKMLRRLIGEHIQTEFKPAPDLGNLRADEGEIEQVLMNLAVNARDAMPDGGTLIIETRNVDLDEDYCELRTDMKPGPYVLLRLTDTGCGMDERTRKQIFEPFFTTKELGKGTGLGLATVYGIVRQHGGDITVHSEVGQGSTFDVYLPRVDVEVDPVETSDDSAGQHRGEETILLVEDDDAVREVARRSLEQKGYRTLVAADPTDAERLFRQHGKEIDLLLTDVVMPGMDGTSLHRRLRRGNGEIRVLFMSGYPELGVARMQDLGPGAHFLPKPFAPAQLVETVRTILDS